MYVEIQNQEGKGEKWLTADERWKRQQDILQIYQMKKKTMETWCPAQGKC